MSLKASKLDSDSEVEIVNGDEEMESEEEDDWVPALQGPLYFFAFLSKAYSISWNTKLGLIDRNINYASPPTLWDRS